MSTLIVIGFVMLTLMCWLGSLLLTHLEIDRQAGWLGWVGMVAALATLVTALTGCEPEGTQGPDAGESHFDARVEYDAGSALGMQCSQPADCQRPMQCTGLTQVDFVCIMKCDSPDLCRSLGGECQWVGLVYPNGSAVESYLCMPPERE